MGKIILAALVAIFMMTTFSAMAWTHGQHSHRDAGSHHSGYCPYN